MHTARASLERRVRSPRTLHFGRRVYSGLRRLDEARRFLSQAIALAGGCPQLYIDLGTVLLRMGRNDNAVGIFKAGLDAPSATAATLELDPPIALLRSLL